MSETKKLSDILKENYPEDRKVSPVNKEVKRSNPSSSMSDIDDDSTLPEDEAKAFLAEMEGDSAEIDNIKSLDDLLIHPQEGSLIMAFKDPKRRTKSHVLKFATDSFIPNIAPILFSDDIPMEMYVIFRLVLPHKKAIAVAEKIGKLAKENNINPTEVLSQISGMDVKDRSDLKKILVRVLNYHPHIGSTLGSFFSKINIKTY